jgi:hypothetical protein
MSGKQNFCQEFFILEYRKWTEMGGHNHLTVHIFRVTKRETSYIILCVGIYIEMSMEYFFRPNFPL